ncbi:hypothetical protein KGM_203089 [Danaus plexippus plexippus]|uniref:Secreted protein n=1 Tax=Danaus plexippus plexippus TaxID=278856 RepID=A0A212F061_DANPL|nr:hypothetical protein KGM_203089 [Danaus plexippus plexippus]
MSCVQHILQFFLFSALFHFIRCNRRSGNDNGDPLDDLKGPQGIPGQGPAGWAGEADKNRFTMPSTTMVMIYRKTEKRIEFKQTCNYLVYYCLHAYRHVFNTLYV